jgi:hypothetical protein
MLTSRVQRFLGMVERSAIRRICIKGRKMDQRKEMTVREHPPVDFRVPRGTYPLHDLVHSGLARVLGPTAIAIHQCLWVFDQQHEECRPSVETVAHLTGMNRHTVSKALDKLVGVGLVTIAKRGLSNIYTLQWQGLRFAPLPPKPARAGGLGPYRAVAEKELVDWKGGEDGTSPKAVYGRRTHTYPSIDGHRLGSLREVMVCNQLTAYRIPHWTGVSYRELLPSWKGKHTVDFLLAPGVVLEVWCVSHKGYLKEKRRKEAALAAAGITLIGISEQDLTNIRGVITRDGTTDMVREAWKRATQKELDPWLERMRLDESQSARIVREWLKDRCANTDHGTSAPNDQSSATPSVPFVERDRANDVPLPAAESAKKNRGEIIDGVWVVASAINPRRRT